MIVSILYTAYLFLCHLILTNGYSDDAITSFYHDGIENQICKPLSTPDAIKIVPVAPTTDYRVNTPVLTVMLNETIKGNLTLNNKSSEDIWLKKSREIEGERIEEDSIRLTPLQSSHRTVKLLSPRKPGEGQWSLVIPSGYFEIQPDYVEVDSIDLPEYLLKSLAVGGSWHVNGKGWKGTAMFTVHDDDGMDGYIPSSAPSEGYTNGYFSILYPLLESLGLKGCVSLEGRRAGWTAGWNNDNVKILKRLQDEKGWEVQSHSMSCLGELLRNWMVDDLNSDLAQKILREGENKGPQSSLTESVYDLSLGKQFMPLEDRSGWIEADSIRVRPYIGDYKTKKSVMYNPDFSINYHWGEWFRKAEIAGIEGRTWVTHNTSSSHANVPLINAICPNGFADMTDMEVNYPPLLSTACRMMMEGQTLPDYDMDSNDNGYNKKHYKYYKAKIDEALKNGGWVVMGLHAYRKCWKNYHKGALVSEGGKYPDAWVNPLEGIDPLSDPLTPPSKLGITDWSEWYPCPGTRLEMAWDLLRYARDRGLINVTSAEGFKNIGNKVGIGYFNKGFAIGQDRDGLIDTRDKYPHYIVGANDEVFYYQSFLSDEIRTDISISWSDWEDPQPSGATRYYDIGGRPLPGLPSGGIFLKRNCADVVKIIR